LVTSKPAEFIKAHQKGTIEIGKDADFVIWNPEESTVIQNRIFILGIK
jgi:imidazolonepropionase-like amidohydrolase